MKYPDYPSFKQDVNQLYCLEHDMLEPEYTITFRNSVKDRKNTWLDWRLIPASRPTIALPGVNTKFVTIPGRDTFIDLSTYLTGRITLTARSGSFEFIADNWAPDYDWKTLRDDMYNFLHGQWLTMTLGSEQNREFTGRFSFGGLTPGDTFSTVSIGYQVQP